MKKRNDSKAQAPAQQADSGTGRPASEFPSVWPYPLVYEVGDKLAEARAIAEEIVAAIERGQKRFEDLPPTWYTVEQAATYLNLSPDTIERLAACGKLKSAEVRTDRSKGRRSIRRFRRKWLNEFMEATCPPPPPPPVDPETRRRRPKPEWREYIK